MCCEVTGGELCLDDGGVNWGEEWGGGEFWVFILLKFGKPRECWVFLVS